jgi:hypothetical protein
LSLAAIFSCSRIIFYLWRRENLSNNLTQSALISAGISFAESD